MRFIKECIWLTVIDVFFKLTLGITVAHIAVFLGILFILANDSNRKKRTNAQSKSNSNNHVSK